ncbi:DinB family protein [Spongisporangium articulatum]|uniref:DinB family protein n=1 Tax=Spongisporangium articulatum TaxID=3362603 RepID=A0ABW8AS84_9ACTN
MTTSTQSSTTLTREREDLLESLGRHRYFLRFAVQGLTEEQARLRPTASELSLGGLIKHVAATEKQWADFIVNGGSAMGFDPEAFAAGEISDEAVATYASGFELVAGETLAGALAEYEAVAAATDDLVRSLPSLDADHELPKAPWFEPGKRWSARRVLLHIVAETAQHAGHADILRESIDGQKTMG